MAAMATFMSKAMTMSIVTHAIIIFKFGLSIFVALHTKWQQVPWRRKTIQDNQSFVSVDRILGYKSLKLAIRVVELIKRSNAWPCHGKRLKELRYF
jgi:hypothetical protein